MNGDGEDDDHDDVDKKESSKSHHILNDWPLCILNILKDFSQQNASP